MHDFVIPGLVAHYVECCICLYMRRLNVMMPIVQDYMTCVWSLLWLYVAKDPVSILYVYSIKQTLVGGSTE